MWYKNGIKLKLLRLTAQANTQCLPTFATLAQLVERLTCNEDVVSSTLTGGSIFNMVK